jgi:hypothetical protein
VGYGLEDRGSRVRFPGGGGLRIFLFATAALGPTQPPIPWVLGAAPSLEVKRPESEAEHSPPFSAEFKNEWSYTFTLSVRLHGVVLKKKAEGLSILTFMFTEQIP